MASHGVTFDEFTNDVQLEVLQVLEAQYVGEQGRTEFLKKLGPTYAETADKMDWIRFGALENDLSQGADPLLQGKTASLAGSPSYTSSSSQGSESGLSIHGLLTRSTEEMLDNGPHHKPKLPQAYKMFEKNLCNNMVPEPSAIAKLIQAFGRAGDLEKVREFYTVAQDVLALLPPSKQLSAWAQIENSMVVALAHAGYPDVAHVHRIRILDQGMVPSADAYGVLIQHVKDTTDDTSGTMALFQEALERGVAVNLYLYNNIISKLSKARKADYALKQFQQMKSANIVPSSITYGAVIGACARVGDVKSAELLFQEMVHSRNFRPRVPPYNTMMQLYTATKPSRVSALHYYKEMKDAGVKPSAHTRYADLNPFFPAAFSNRSSLFSCFLTRMVPLSLWTFQLWKMSSTNSKMIHQSNSLVRILPHSLMHTAALLSALTRQSPSLSPCVQCLVPLLLMQPSLRLLSTSSWLTNELNFSQFTSRR